MKLLDARKIPASFFIPSVSLALHPEMGPLIAKGGRNEIAVHGWVHEMNATLPDSAERALLTKAVDELTRATVRRISRGACSCGADKCFRRRWTSRAP